MSLDMILRLCGIPLKKGIKHIFDIEKEPQRPQSLLRRMFSEFLSVLVY